MKTTETICLKCLNKFSHPLATKRKFCSAQCADNLFKVAAHICLNCGICFKKKSKTLGKYCSQACYFSHKQDISPKNKCLQCGTEFKILKKKKNYCSLKCKELSYPAHITINCKKCGIEFASTISRNSTRCSQKCGGLLKETDQQAFESLKKRYAKKVIKQGDNKCWSWKGWTRKGYGGISYKDKELGAHRASYIIHIGEIPDGMHVLHNCPGGDNRICSNPKHLWIGTNDDNVADMVAKGRNIKGESHYLHKLTAQQIVEIKQLLYMGIKHKEIAKKFDINRSTVGSIKNKKSWKSVSNPDIDSIIKNMKQLHKGGKELPFAKLTDEKVIEIKKLAKSGLSTIELMGLYNISKSAINKIKRGETWKHVKLEN